MESTNTAARTPVYKPAFTYGLLTAIGLIMLTFIIYLTGMISNQYINYLSYFIIIAGIVLGTKAFRDEFRGGFLSYGNALGFGTLTILFAAIIAGVFSFVFYSYLAPDALAQLKVAAEVRILETNPNVSDQELDLALRFVSPTLMLFTSIISYTFVGFLLSLVTSAFLKKQDPLDI